MKNLKKYSKYGLEEILKDLFNRNLKHYDVKKLKSSNNMYRLRKGKIRIIWN